MWALAATAGVAAFAASGAAFVSDTGPTIYAIGLGIGVLLSAVAIWLRVGSTGGKRKEADWENKKARFDERFVLEVEPSLRIAGVSGVGGLFEYRATTQTIVISHVVPRSTILDRRIMPGVKCLRRWRRVG